ncbi:uncharacterized protein OCT59_023388 [Rhizophagus irregularis]|uniref:uncharacterized protein n=1 Tax=Rhizophagus irregularis TaxID=588596 RepID=UPI000CAA17CC|nr:hypothetical protein OCT59_023388 [Rhizophagus irregularis]
MEDDPIYDIHSKEYIDDLVHVTIQRGLFKDVEDAIKSIKALAKMVISSKTSIDAFMKCPVPNIPKAFYDLVEAFYYSLLASVECPEGQEKAILENRSR